MTNTQHNFREITERPQDYLGPNLNPNGLVLKPLQLGKGIYALLAISPRKIIMV